MVTFLRSFHQLAQLPPELLNEKHVARSSALIQELCEKFFLTAALRQNRKVQRA
jgi:hypothetical protein